MCESVNISNQNDFDGYVRKRGWIYDNGWTHVNENWDCYWAPEEYKGHYMLRQSPERVKIINVNELNVTEIWSGKIANNEDFDLMLEELRNLVK